MEHGPSSPGSEAVPRRITLPDDERPVRPLRLLYVHLAEDLGGPERQGVLQIAGLPEHGIDVVPVVGPRPPILAELAAYGVADYVFNDQLPHFRASPTPGKRRLARTVELAHDWLATQRWLVRTAREREVDLVLASGAPGWIASSLAAHWLGLPLVWVGGQPVTGRAALALKVLGPLFRPDLLIASCDAVREAVSRPLGCPGCVIHHGVDSQRFDPARVTDGLRAELGIPPGTPILGVLLQSPPEKGRDLLVEALAEVAIQLPDLRVVVTVDPGWRAHHERVFRDRGLGGTAIFLGRLEQVERVYRICDLFALASSEPPVEGTPAALLEAMAMECPIVATAVGGVGEAVTDGLEGTLVPATDTAGFVSAVVGLLHDSDLRRRMGAAGRATILSRFNREVVVEELAAVLWHLAGEPGPRDLLGGRRRPAVR